MSDEEMARGQVFPDVERIRDVSLDVAVNVVRSALEDGLVKNKNILAGEDIRSFVQRKSYFPAYVPVVTDPMHFDQ